MISYPGRYLTGLMIVMHGAPLVARLNRCGRVVVTGSRVGLV